MMQGRRFGLASVAGVALGNFGNAVGASIGLAALFAVSSLAFLTVKYAGALYLVYLAAPALARARGIGAFGRSLTGGAFIGLGIFTALAASRSGK